MQDAYQREINYLRVSVTDRCNLRCVYCMPPGGVKLISHDQVLRNEEIVRLVNAAAMVGITKIRLTGGEPLVRKGLAQLVEAIAEVPGIDDIALTTNGILLPSMADTLKEAGLKRVNISLDTLDPGLFRRITRSGEIDQVWKGIDTALDRGLNPVKINTVVMRGINDSEIGEIAALTLKYPLHVRFIELMPVGVSDAWAKEKVVPTAKIKSEIEGTLGTMGETHKPFGNGPARYYHISGAPGTIGFISAVSNHFCQGCNRLRLTSEGMIRPCLHNGFEINARTPLRSGAGDLELASLFRQAVMNKPHQHSLHSGWNDEKRMSQIGG